MLYRLDDIEPTTPEAGQFFVADNATVIGRVTLAVDSSIWFNAVLRGDQEEIAIGEGSNVQEGCVMHTDPGFPLTVGAGCTIGHQAMLHGCTIGDDALVGIGAIVMNGASIGAGSLVAAGSLVTPGKVLPERSLIVGSPAKVLRELTDEEVAKNAEGVEHYLDFARMFREAGLGSG